MADQGGGRHWSWSPTITGGWASPTMLPATWQGVMPATSASRSQHRRWGTGSQPTAGRLSLLTPLENYWSLKWLTLQELHAFSLSMSGGTTDFWRPSSV